MMGINSRRGEGGEHVGKIGMALAGVIVISAAGRPGRLPGVIRHDY